MVRAGSGARELFLPKGLHSTMCVRDVTHGPLGTVELRYLTFAQSVRMYLGES